MASLTKRIRKNVIKIEKQFAILQKNVDKTSEKLDVRELVREKTQIALKEFQKTKNKRKADRKKYGVTL